MTLLPAWLYALAALVGFALGATSVWVVFWTRKAAKRCVCGHARSVHGGGRCAGSLKCHCRFFYPEHRT